MKSLPNNVRFLQKGDLISVSRDYLSRGTRRLVCTGDADANLVRVHVVKGMRY